MPALTDLPELIGFFSYSREDDEDSSNGLSALRTRIQNELRARLGRSRNELRLWQDQEAIAPGTMWENQITAAINQSVFFVPIITPRVIHSKYCGIEFHRFLDRERELGRDDLVFPVLYIDVDELEDEKVWRQHPVLKEIGARQYVDWREHRYEADSPALRRAVATFSAKIVGALQRSVLEVGQEAVVAEGATKERLARDEEQRRRDQAKEARQREEAEAAARERAQVEQQQREEAERVRRAQQDKPSRDGEPFCTLVQQAPPERATPVLERSPTRSALEWGSAGAASVVIAGFASSTLISTGGSPAVALVSSLIFVIAAGGMFLRSGSGSPIVIGIVAGAFVTRSALGLLFSQIMMDEPYLRLYLSNTLIGILPFGWFVLEPRLRSASLLLKIFVLSMIVGVLDSVFAANGLVGTVFLALVYAVGAPARFVIFALIGYELARWPSVRV